MKGLGLALWFSRHSMMALLSSATLLKGAASDAVLRDLGKEALDHVEPGSRGRMSAFRSCFGAAQSS
jgi:hypothetical protein